MKTNTIVIIKQIVVTAESGEKFTLGFAPDDYNYPEKDVGTWYVLDSSGSIIPPGGRLFVGNLDEPAFIIQIPQDSE